MTWKHTSIIYEDSKKCRDRYIELSYTVVFLFCCLVRVEISYFENFPFFLPQMIIGTLWNYHAS